MEKIKVHLNNIFEDKKKEASNMRRDPNEIVQEESKTDNQQPQVIMVTEQQIILERLNYLNSRIDQVFSLLESFKQK